MNWQEIEQSVQLPESEIGGYSHASRGFAKLANGERIFVKRAVDTQTQTWIDREKKAYHWLTEQSYTHIPQVVAEGPNSFALTDLSKFDWSYRWSNKKLNAAFEAMDSLAVLSAAAKGVFGHFKESNPWRDVPVDAKIYHNVTKSTQKLHRLEALLADKDSLHQELLELSDNHPEIGDTLIHLDVRSDNFCYDIETRKGYLIDWNWLSLGNEAFDVTALLVSVQQRGFDVLAYCPERLDAASLAHLIGFWLAEAALPSDSPQALKRHKHQLNAALTALDLYIKVR